jgi:hypothetical protein
MLLGLLALGSAGGAARADEVSQPEPPRAYLQVAAGPLVGAHRYFNSGGIAVQIRGGWRLTRTIGIEALASAAYLSGGEGRSWHNPFEPRTGMGSFRVGPRWGLALGDGELSAGLHAGYMNTGSHGFAADLSVAFEYRLTDTVRAGLFASGMGAANGYDSPGQGLYVEGGPFVRIFVGD